MFWGGLSARRGRRRLPSPLCLPPWQLTAPPHWPAGPDQTPLFVSKLPYQHAPLCLRFRASIPPCPPLPLMLSTGTRMAGTHCTACPAAAPPAASACLWAAASTTPRRGSTAAQNARTAWVRAAVAGCCSKVTPRKGRPWVQQGQQARAHGCTSCHRVPLMPTSPCISPAALVRLRQNPRLPLLQLAAMQARQAPPSACRPPRRGSSHQAVPGQGLRRAGAVFKGPRVEQPLLLLLWGSEPQ